MSAGGGVPVRDALDSAVVALGAAGIESPRLDAEVLLAWALGVERAALVMDPATRVSGPAIRVYQDAIRRRSIGREPVAYVTGTKGFRHLDLHVDARVLIPRPETETLVEAALELPSGVSVVDVGTGSGAVALALAHERPDLRVTATDTSDAALAVARDNATRLGLDVRLLRADLLDGVPGAHAVLANAPYVEEAAVLAPEIADHEPAAALYAGPDGLTVIRRLVAQAGAGQARLLALEVGAGQAGAVAELMGAAGFGDVHARRDLAGIERVVVGRRR